MRFVVNCNKKIWHLTFNHYLERYFPSIKSERTTDVMGVNPPVFFQETRGIFAPNNFGVYSMLHLRKTCMTGIVASIALMAGTAFGSTSVIKDAGIGIDNVQPGAVVEQFLIVESGSVDKWLTNEAEIDQIAKTGDNADQWLRISVDEVYIAASDSGTLLRKDIDQMAESVLSAASVGYDASNLDLRISISASNIEQMRGVADAKQTWLVAEYGDAAWKFLHEAGTEGGHMGIPTVGLMGGNV